MESEGEEVLRHFILLREIINYNLFVRDQLKFVKGMQVCFSTNGSSKEVENLGSGQLEPPGGQRRIHHLNSCYMGGERFEFSRCCAAGGRDIFIGGGGAGGRYVIPSPFIAEELRELPRKPSRHSDLFSLFPMLKEERSEKYILFCICISLRVEFCRLFLFSFEQQRKKNWRALSDAILVGNKRPDKCSKFHS